MIERYSRSQMAEVWSQGRKFANMLKVELLVCEAWCREGAIPKKAMAAIRASAKIDIPTINMLEEKTRHDVVAFVNNLSESVGENAKYVHMGLTSNDVLDTALGLTFVQAFDLLIEGVEDLREVLAKSAKKYKNTPCIGRTHGVHAEPTSFGWKIALWHDEMTRHLARLKTAKDEVAVGKLSGTIGTYTNIEPTIEEYVCVQLGLKQGVGATQVVSRDRHAMALSVLAVVGASLEKFALEIRHLQKTETDEAQEPFGKGQKGSSAMPHKRNPVMCERICGLARILRANAVAGFENVALWHERDISHSSVERVILPDSFILLDYILSQFKEVMENLLVLPKNMILNLGRTNGLIYSQKVLLKLMEKGMPRPQAYDLVQKNAFLAHSGNRDFKEILCADPKVKKFLSANEIEACFDIRPYLRHISTIFKKLGLE